MCRGRGDRRMRVGSLGLRRGDEKRGWEKKGGEGKEGGGGGGIVKSYGRNFSGAGEGD